MHDQPAPVAEPLTAESIAQVADPFLAQLPAIAIAGSVASEEEAFRVQQIATITRWLRHFSRAAESGLPNSASLAPAPEA